MVNLERLLNEKKKAAGHIALAAALLFTPTPELKFGKGITINDNIPTSSRVSTERREDDENPFKQAKENSERTDFEDTNDGKPTFTYIPPYKDF